MNVRKGMIQDLESITMLFNKYREFYKKETDLSGAEKFISDRITNNESEIYIAENDENIITGFVQLYPIFSSTRMKRLWLLNDLFVLPEYRGQGVSTALIDACKNLCKQTDSCGLILETAKDNTIGNSLYLKTGFVPDSHHNYYEWEV